MIIDFDGIAEQALQNFKGGEGELLTRNYVDACNKIMMSSLRPGASSGYHVHEQNSEIVCIFSGTGHFMYDGAAEPFGPGAVHYCPMGHGHSMHNDGTEDVVYLAIVPEHKVAE